MTPTLANQLPRLNLASDGSMQKLFRFSTRVKEKVSAAVALAALSHTYHSEFQSCPEPHEKSVVAPVNRSSISPEWFGPGSRWSEYSHRLNKDRDVALPRVSVRDVDKH